MTQGNATQGKTTQGKATQASAQYPLKGIKVVELSSMITCALAAMTMRGQGASVIKVEPLGIGDAMRKVGTQKSGISTLFNNCNRGKRSLAIDLKSEAGTQALLDLVKNADVLLHNYRPGVMDRLGFGSETLRGLNKKLVYIGVSGFGHLGPMADKPAYDHVIQGLSGLADLQGEGDDYSYVRSLICDKVTAYTVGQAATAALLARASTGVGQHIDISMLHACLAFLWPDMMMNHTMPEQADVTPLPPISDYYQVLSLKDGSITMAPLHDHHWQALLPMLGYGELLDDARFNSMAGRAANMDLAMGLLRRPKTDINVAQAIEILEAADVPCTICETRDTLSENDQVNAIGALETYVTQNLGQITVPTPPVWFDGAATSLAEPSPAHGEHSVEILQELGFDAAHIDRLLQQGIVTCA